MRCTECLSGCIYLQWFVAAALHTVYTYCVGKGLNYSGKMKSHVEVQGEWTSVVVAVVNHGQLVSLPEWSDQTLLITAVECRALADLDVSAARLQPVSGLRGIHARYLCHTHGANV